MRPIESQAVETYMPSWAKEKGGGGLGLQREGRQFTRSWEKQVVGTQMFVLPHRDSGTQEFSLQALPTSLPPQFTTPNPYSLQLSLVIALKKKGKKLFLSLLDRDGLQLKLIHMPKGHIWGRLIL